MKHSDIVSVEEEESFVEDENYATLQSLLSVENQDPEIIMVSATVSIYIYIKFMQ